MFRKYLVGTAVLGLTFVGLQAQAQAQKGALTGGASLACEALLCLSSASLPRECAPALRRYFSIAHRRPAQMQRLRSRFLHLCPVAYQTLPMAALLAAQAHAQQKQHALLQADNAQHLGPRAQ